MYFTFYAGGYVHTSGASMELNRLFTRPMFDDFLSCFEAFLKGRQVHMLWLHFKAKCTIPDDIILEESFELAVFWIYPVMHVKLFAFE
jgi:hypothetical protein